MCPNKQLALITRCVCVSGINHSSDYVKRIALKVGNRIVDNLVVLIPSTAMLMLNIIVYFISVILQIS